MLPSRSVLAAIALLSACVADTDDASPEASVVRTQLDSVWVRLERAMASADTAALTTLYTDSAVFAETGGPTIRGSVAIRAGAASVFACCKYVESRFKPELTDVSGNRAFQFGTYRDVIQPAGQAALAMHGRVSAVLERDSAGVWRISRLVAIRDSSVRLTSEKD